MASIAEPQSIRTDAVAYEWVLVAAVTGVGAALRLWAIDAKPLWLDEAFSVWVAAQSTSELLRFVAAVDHHPPLYYLLLHFWQSIFGDGQGVVRIPSAILGAASIPLFYLSGRIFVRRKAAMLAALLLAASPFHVRYGQEARMYALLVFLMAALLYCLAVWLADSAPGSRRRRLAMMGLGLAELGLLYTHNVTAMLLPLALNAGVLGPWLIGRRRGMYSLAILDERRFMATWISVQVLVFALWLPWLPAYWRQATTVYADFWIEPLTASFIWLTFHNYILAYPVNWQPLAPLWDAFYAAMAIGGLWALRKSGAIAFLLATLFLTPAIVAIFASLWRPILYDRTLIWTTLPYYLLVGCGIVWTAERLQTPRRVGTAGRSLVVLSRKGLALAAPILLLLLLPAYSLSAYYRGYAKENWPALTRYVAEYASEDDLVLFNASWGQIPFDYYAEDALPPLIMRGLPVDLFADGELESRMTLQDVSALQLFTQGHDNAWLVYTHEWYTDPDGLIPAALEIEFDLVEVREFDGPRVLHYARIDAAP